MNIGEVVTDIAQLYGFRKKTKDDEEELKKNFRKVDLDNCLCRIDGKKKYYIFDTDFKYYYRGEQIDDIKKIIKLLGDSIDEVYYKPNMPLFILFSNNIAMLAPSIEDSPEEIIEIKKVMGCNP